MVFSSANFDPFRLSAELENVALRYEAFQRELAHRAPRLDPFGGKEFPGLGVKTLVQALDERDPLRAPLMRWVVHLTTARVLLPWDLHDRELLSEEKHILEQPAQERLSLKEVRARAMSADGTQGESWWRNVSALEPRLSAHRIGRAGHAQEVSRRLGFNEVAKFWDPLFPSDAAAEADSEAQSLVALAEQLLAETDDVADNAWQKGWPAFFEAGLATEAADGWPARLAPDTLRRLLGEKELFRGLILEPGPLPERLYPVSFLRAAAQIGRALCRALEPRDLPFVVRRDAHDLRGHQVASLFCLWSQSAPFLMQRLGQSRILAKQDARSLTRALVVHARLSAVRLILCHALSRGEDAIRGTFQELSLRLLGTELEAESALARFRVRHDEQARFVGLLSALARYESLKETYNEDWYLNPRAQEDLRAELMLPAPVQVSSALCARGILALSTRIRENLQ